MKKKIKNTEIVIKDLKRIRNKLQKDVERRQGCCSALFINKIVTYTDGLIENAERLDNTTPGITLLEDKRDN